MTILAECAEFACVQFVRFCARRVLADLSEKISVHKVLSAECWPENFPITKIFFLCAGRKFVQEFMSTMIFSSTMHKFSGEFPEKWENPEKGPFWGTPPWTPQKPPKTPQNPPPGGASLGEWYTTLHLATASHSTGWQKLPEYALIRIAAGGGGWQKSPILDPPPGAQNHRFSTFFPLRRPREMDQFSCSAEILIVYAPRKFLDNHFMIVRGRAEPRHRADVRVMNVFTLMTPTLCTARRSEKHPTGPTSNLHQFLCARILAHPKFPPAQISQSCSSRKPPNTWGHNSVTQLCELCGPRSRVFGGRGVNIINTS